MLYMIVERFRGDPVPVYRRFRDQGRLAPEGLRYVSSWVTQDLQRAASRSWSATTRSSCRRGSTAGRILVDFEITPVKTSAEAAAEIAPRL